MTEQYIHIEHRQTPEGTTCVVHCFFKDDAGAVLGAADLFSLTAKLYDKEDPSMVVAGWDDKDVLTAGGGTFDPTTKKYSLRIPAIANNPLRPLESQEIRMLLLKYSYNAGVDKGVFVAQYPIDSLTHVP